MGAEHPILGNKDVKFMKICTIILIGTMTLALKVLAMFTLSMSTLTFESVMFIYGWMPAHMALVTGVFLLSVNIRKIKKKYFEIIKPTKNHKKKEACSISIFQSGNMVPAFFWQCLQSLLQY